MGKQSEPACTTPGSSVAVSRTHRGKRTNCKCDYATRFSAGILAAQVSPVPVTLAGAIEQALKNYRSIHVSQEKINAVAAAIQLARTAYLPRINALRK